MITRTTRAYMDLPIEVRERAERDLEEKSSRRHDWIYSSFPSCGPMVIFKRRVLGGFRAMLASEV